MKHSVEFAENVPQFVAKVVAFFRVLTVRHPPVFLVTPWLAMVADGIFFRQVDFMFGRPKSDKYPFDGRVK